MENLNKPSTVNVEVEPSAGEPSDNIGQTTTAQSDDNTVVENPNLNEAWDAKVTSLENLETKVEELDTKITELQEKQEKTKQDLEEIESTLKNLETYKRYVKMTYYACERLLDKANEGPAVDSSEDILKEVMAEAREKFPAPQKAPEKLYQDSQGLLHSSAEAALASEPETRYSNRDN